MLVPGLLVTVILCPSAVTPDHLTFPTSAKYPARPVKCTIGNRPGCERYMRPLIVWSAANNEVEREQNCSKLKTSWLECLPYPRCDHCGHHFIRPKADIPVRKPSLLTLVFTVLRVAPVKNLIKGGNSSSGSVATS